MKRVTVRGLATVVAAGLLVAPAISTSAQADPVPPSTPVPIDTPDGMLMSYLINTDQSSKSQVRKVERAVERSGGVVVMSWPQIGVVLAHSDREAFRTDVVDRAGRQISSIGPTRTVEVADDETASVGREDAPGTRQPSAAPTAAGGTPVADPRESEQWALPAIRADRAHEITDGSRDVLVGILDTGVDVDHPDLAANVDRGASVDCTQGGRPVQDEAGYSSGGHGTHVAGIVAAARNGIGTVGIAPDVRIASIKVAADWIYPEYMVCGMVWAAAHGVDVTNNSYNVDPFDFFCGDQPEQDASLEAVQRAIDFATSKGIVHTAAAGNNGRDLALATTDSASPYDGGGAVDRVINDTCKRMPAQLDNVVAVSNVTSTLQLKADSNRGYGVIDVGAPGGSILSTIDGGGYASWSGTSMSSPQVAGVFALMKSAHPRWSATRMTRALLRDANDQECLPAENEAGDACYGGPRYNSYYGEGMVDAYDAVR